MKLKFDISSVKQVRLNMIPKENWLRVRTKKTDIKCQNCNREFKDLDTNIALMTITGNTNKHLCEECGKEYIKNGAEDIEQKILERAKIKKELLSKILSFGFFKPKEDATIEDLEKILSNSILEKEKEDAINSQLNKYNSEWDKEEVKMLIKIDNKEIFTEREIQTLIWEFKEVDSIEGVEGRWSRHMTTIVKLGDRFFSIDWERGLTERQDNYGFNQPEEVELEEKEITIIQKQWITIR